MSVSLMCKSVLGCRRVFHTFQKRFIIDMSYSHHFMDYKSSSIPSSMKKMMVTKLSPDFREAVSIQTVPVPAPSDRELLVRTRYVGINASDVNYSAGRYNPSLRPPFPVGFEGVGEVVGLGLSASSRFAVGDAVAYLNPGAFAEYSLISVEKAIPLKKLQPEALTVIVSGATALIALQRLGEIKKGKTVLVTAAAGGTGHFAVQFAKMAGCHVVGTCSSREKVKFLKSIGCDRPINYKEEDLATTLRREYPKGVDVVYESVGGAVFDLAVNNLAKHGRLIVLGFISGYQSESGMQPIRGATLPAKLLHKSASVRGFFLEHFLSEYREGVQKIMQMHEEGKILCAIDDGQMDKGGRFVGLESVYTAIDYMYSGKNKGKVVLEVNPDQSNICKNEDV